MQAPADLVNFTHFVPEKKNGELANGDETPVEQRKLIDLLVNIRWGSSQRVGCGTGVH